MVIKWHLSQVTSKYWRNSQESEACELHCGGKSKRDGGITGAGMRLLPLHSPGEARRKVRYFASLESNMTQGHN